MSLHNLKPWIVRAQRDQYAIGAFNANTMEQVQAIVLAAQAENAPVIIQISHHALQYVGSGNVIIGLRYMAEIGKVAAQSVSVPVALHLDHATENEVIQAIGLGFTSVMFDADERPLQENIDVTKKLCEMAHLAGVSIEAELGEVPRADSSGVVQSATELTHVEDAAGFVYATGIDTLAIAIGSVHAVKQKHVELDLERLKAIRAAVDIPLVLHGSSGVTDACVAEGIKLGLCKVNVATQLNQAFTRAVRARLSDDPNEVDPRRYLNSGRDAMVEEVRERIRFVGAAGKAAHYDSVC
jgi:fructose-bisphosphate aldolase class II